MNRIPTLDGWRGIAIALVLLDHLQFAFLGAPIRGLPATGPHGVTVFFVLSGFLITSVLLDRPAEPGNAPLRVFYVRRFFRLMPVAWVYLATMVLLNALTRIRVISLPEICASVFFYRNLVPKLPGSVTGHFWSLSLEEQFYLAWPPLLALIGLRRARWLAPAAAVACAAWRYWHWAFYIRTAYSVNTAVRADALLVGCALALWMRESVVRKIIIRAKAWPALPAFVVFLGCIVRFNTLPPLIESISIAALIATSTSFSRAAWCHWLDWKPLAGLGRISYSLYVWQMVFVVLHVRGFPILPCLLPFFAAASYFLVEKPCIRVGRRLTTVKQTEEPVCVSG